MPRKANQSNEWDFKVVPVRLHLPDGRPSNMIVNAREDTGWVFGQRSEKGYGLIQNADFVSTIRNALTGLGMTDYNESILITGNGARIYATYEFDQRIKTVNKVGDKVGLVLRFADSKDGTLSAMGELMAKILRCLNGCATEKGEFSLYQRHNANINLEFVKTVIANAVENFDAALHMFDRLSEVAVSDEQGVNLIKRLPLSEKARDSIQTIWINPNFAVSRARTLFALYDAATEYLRDISKDRFEHAAKANRQILHRIVSGLDPAKLAELTAKIQAEEAQVIDITASTVQIPTAPEVTPPTAPEVNPPSAPDNI